MSKRYAIVNVNLEYELPDDVRTEDEIQKFVENVELPSGYVSDSFEYVKIITENQIEEMDNLKPLNSSRHIKASQILNEEDLLKEIALRDRDIWQSCKSRR